MLSGLNAVTCQELEAEGGADKAFPNRERGKKGRKGLSLTALPPIQHSCSAPKDSEYEQAGPSSLDSMLLVGFTLKVMLYFLICRLKFCNLDLHVLLCYC